MAALTDRITPVPYGRSTITFTSCAITRECYLVTALNSLGQQFEKLDHCAPCEKVEIGAMDTHFESTTSFKRSLQLYET